MVLCFLETLQDTLLPSLRQGLFLFFSTFINKEITDAVTLLLVLPLALMENVKGAQHRPG